MRGVDWTPRVICFCSNQVYDTCACVVLNSFASVSSRLFVLRLGLTNTSQVAPSDRPKGARRGETCERLNVRSLSLGCGTEAGDGTFITHPDRSGRT